MCDSKVHKNYINELWNIIFVCHQSKVYPNRRKDLRDGRRRADTVACIYLLSALRRFVVLLIQKPLNFYEKLRMVFIVWKNVTALHWVHIDQWRQCRFRLLNMSSIYFTIIFFLQNHWKILSSLIWKKTFYWNVLCWAKLTYSTTKNEDTRKISNIDVTLCGKEVRRVLNYLVLLNFSILRQLLPNPKSSNLDQIFFQITENFTSINVNYVLAHKDTFFCFQIHRCTQRDPNL